MTDSIQHRADNPRAPRVNFRRAAAARLLNVEELLCRLSDAVVERNNQL